jgi:hypothetical protein
MALGVTIKDGTGSENEVVISDDHSLYVSPLPFPPLIKQKTKPFRHYLTVDGSEAGSNDMGVDGSSTNVDFYIKADNEKDRYITNLSFIIGYGATGKPYLWGDGAALTNGCRLFYTSESGEQDIHDGLKSNQDLCRLAFTLMPVGWEVRHLDANNDYGFMISMDLRKLGLPNGIKLDRGSSERLVMRIRDNAGAAADSFNCIAYGFERFE